LLTTSSLTLLFLLFNLTPFTSIFTLSLHDALPIYLSTNLASHFFDLVIGKILTSRLSLSKHLAHNLGNLLNRSDRKSGSAGMPRSEERFSRNAETELVCRLLLEKKKDIEQRILITS